MNRRVRILPLLPAALLVFCFLILPGAIIAILSLRPGTSFQLEGLFSGSFTLEHYRRVLTSADFIDSLRISFVYVASVVAVSASLGLLGAILLHRPFPGRRHVQVLWLLPWSVPGVVVAVLFLWMFNEGFGVVNSVLLRLGIIDERIGWLTDVQYALIGVVIPTAWKTYPFVAMTLIAALKSIPQSLYEAAEVDGANPFQQFRHVTMPAIAPALILSVIIISLLSFKEFDFIYPLTGGGPVGATETLAIGIYNESFRFFRIELAAALGVITTFVAAVIAAVGYRSLRKEYFG